MDEKQQKPSNSGKLLLTIGLIAFFLLCNCAVIMFAIALPAAIEQQEQNSIKELAEQEFNNTFDEEDIDFENRGELMTVLMSLKVFIKKYPDYAPAHQLLGKVNSSLGEVTDATVSFGDSIKYAPQSEKSGYAVIAGSNMREQQEYGLAEKFYQEAIDYDKNNANAYKGLAVTFLQQKKFTEALIYGERAYELDGTNPVNASNLAIIYHFNKIYDKRDIMYKKAKELKYDNMEALDKIFTGEIDLWAE